VPSTVFVSEYLQMSDQVNSSFGESGRGELCMEVPELVDCGGFYGDDEAGDDDEDAIVPGGLLPSDRCTSR
jgi:hypothetical protein